MDFSVEMGEIIRQAKKELADWEGQTLNDIREEKHELETRFHAASPAEIAGMQDEIKRYEALNRKLNGLDYDPQQLFQRVFSIGCSQMMFALSDVLKLKDGRITATLTFDVDGPITDCAVGLHKRNKDYCITLPDNWG